MKSPADMGLEVEDLPRRAFDPRWQTVGDTLEAINGAATDICPECGRPAFPQSLEEYSKDSGTIGILHKVLCAWCGWVQA